MAKSSAGRLTTSQCEVKTFPGDKGLGADLLRLRGLLVVFAAPRGCKVVMARTVARDLISKGLRASVRSLYHWRTRYLLGGVGALARKRRSDLGRPLARTEEWLPRIVEAAGRARRSGDIAREYRRIGPPISYECFRTWLNLLRARNVKARI
jgi:hypothetical protein